MNAFLYHAHAQGVKLSVCMSVIVVIVIVCTKIASLGDLGAWVTSKVNKYVEIGGKLASVYFESFCTDHKRHKYCKLSHACRPHLLIGPCMCSLYMCITALTLETGVEPLSMMQLLIINGCILHSPIHLFIISQLFV